MNQIALKLYPNQPGFKKRGTSEAAAKAVKPMDEINRQKVLECLRLFGPMTCIDIAHALQMDKTSVRPRVSQLFEVGLIVENGRSYENSRSGETIWRVK